MIRCTLSSVKCGTPISFPLGMLLISTICCSTILWQRVKKGNGTPAPPSAIMIADQTQPWLTQFHEILTKKRRKLLTSDGVPPPSRSCHAQVMADGAECSGESRESP